MIKTYKIFAEGFVKQLLKDIEPYGEIRLIFDLYLEKISNLMAKFD